VNSELELVLRGGVEVSSRTLPALREECGSHELIPGFS
jgi:hypothetical protein